MPKRPFLPSSARSRGTGTDPSAVKLYAISDLHIGHPVNRQALGALGFYPDDWLILGGDICETEEDLAHVLTVTTERFDRVFWVPGNHELWTLGSDAGAARGEDKYNRLIALCRSFGVLTPEDPFVEWPGEGSVEPLIIAPLFNLYDYSFRPDHVEEHEAIAWAMETGLLCADESLLHFDPYPSRQAWCAARCEQSVARLQAIPEHFRTVLINHFPLLQEHAVLPMIPRFTIWCGTKRTHDWPARFRASVVVSGHLHIRSTRWKDSVRFEEVSLGYPRQWSQQRRIDDYLREILPGKNLTGANRFHGWLGG